MRSRPVEGIIAAPSVTAAVHTRTIFPTFPHSTRRKRATLWQPHSPFFPDIYDTARDGETKIDKHFSSARQDARVAVAKEMPVAVWTGGSCVVAYSLVVGARRAVVVVFVLHIVRKSKRQKNTQCNQ